MDKKCGNCKHYVAVEYIPEGWCNLTKHRTYKNWVDCTIFDQKDEPKPTLKDGDILNCKCEDGTYENVQVVRGENTSSWDTKPFCVEHFDKDYKIVGNIFDLATCVKNGGGVVGLSSLEAGIVKNALKLYKDSLNQERINNIIAKLDEAMERK